MVAINNTPWFGVGMSHFQLTEKDFILTKKEILNILKIYKELIDVNAKSYNFKFISSRKFFIDFMEFDYEDEKKMEEYMKNLLNEFNFIYSIPIVFNNTEFKNIFRYKPPAIAKVGSNYEDYNRIFNSMISIHSGEFFVISNDLTCICIVKNGHFVIRLHNIKKIYIDNWKNLSDGILEMYLSDKNILIKFKECSC